MTNRRSAAPTPLDGTVAASRGKRLGAWLLDGLILAIVQGSVTAVAWSGIIRQLLAGAKPEQVDATFLPVPGLVGFGLSLAYVIWLWFRGQTPSYVLMGLRMVNQDTAGAPRGRSLIWHILAGLIGSVTLGVATIVILLRPNSKGRNWYDRTSGVAVVDLRAGRDPLAEEPLKEEPTVKEVDPDEALGETITVQAPGLIQGLPVLASQTAPAPADSPMFAPTSSAAPASGPLGVSGSRNSMRGTSPHADAVITAVPWEMGSELPGAAQLQSAPGTPVDAPATTAPPASPAPAASGVPTGASVPSVAPVAAPDPAPSEASVLQLVLRVDTGQRIVLGEGRTVLGREPEARGEWTGALTVPVTDPEMSISKTHLGVLLTAESTTVLDLGSTNGTKMIMPNGKELALDPQEPSGMLEGAMIRMGERLIAVER
ncbi:RDD family protein [Actinomyces trachealis]|uniref:RDD family protein n=1 Tax=Actinomyces trachealis TaxID=2763540 RepID=UPI001892C971|nr:RDD family protein [Actinomyces trachealis]